MRGASAVYFLVLAFVAQAAKNSKPKVSKTTETWTSRSAVNAEELGEHFEGDIILPLPGLDRSGLIDEKYRWPDGRVPFDIDLAFSEYEVATLYRAIEEYHEQTSYCITFSEHKNETDYIFFQKYDRGCSSSVGRRGGMQPIRLGPKCFRRFGTILHEILHALGFFHEQSRTDRDEYVTVMWDNINDEFKGNFRKYSSNMVGPFGVSYDYESVMHYSEFAFTNSAGKTIIPLDPEARIGQRRGFSKKDVKKLMKMYKCEEEV